VIRVPLAHPPIARPVVNAARAIRLEDSATGEAFGIINEIRDEVIALENADEHSTE